MEGCTDEVCTDEGCIDEGCTATVKATRMKGCADGGPSGCVELRICSTGSSPLIEILRRNTGRRATFLSTLASKAASRQVRGQTGNKVRSDGSCSCSAVGSIVRVPSAVSRLAAHVIHIHRLLSHALYDTSFLLWNRGSASVPSLRRREGRHIITAECMCICPSLSWQSLRCAY